MKTKWFLRAFALFAGISFAACGDKEIIPVFPDSVEHTMAAGETKELTFTANTTWTLTADKTWVAFMNGSEEVPSKTGKAGPVTITVKVKDTNHDFDDAVANLVLAMQGKTQTIFTITRPAKERQVKMYKRDSKNFEEITEIELTFASIQTSMLNICFTANFDWKMLSKTDGISLSQNLYGTANQTTNDSELVSARVSIEDDYLSKVVDGKIIISDVNGNNSFEFPVNYSGMDDSEIKVTPSALVTSAGIIFNRDGYLLDNQSNQLPEYSDPDTGDRIIVYEKESNFSVVTKDMKYRISIVELNENNTPNIVTNSWLKVVDDNKGDITISVDGDGSNNDPARSVFLFVLPENIASDFDFAQYFEDGKLAKCPYGFMIHQRGIPTATGGGFLILRGGYINVSEKVERFVDVDEYSTVNLPAGNTHIYRFTNEEINGISVAPIGIGVDPSEYYPFMGLYSSTNYVGSWGDIQFEHTNFKLHWQDPQEYTGIMIGGIPVNQNVIKLVPFENNPDPRTLILKFYLTAADKNADNPVAALIIEQSSSL